ncbi:OpgC domain-containing protein [Paenarthrobacter sp. NPDC091711]|uniref:OpgC domain-containing protein n=1 Tax=Paenarthrobacter sp. NPDC091711 TaxID=3364385 RepID=UPI0038162F2A
MAEPLLNAEPRVRSRRAKPARQRDTAIDLVRGLCIASMVLGHLAPASLLSIGFHIFPKFDGASGFVLLGGLMLGIVRRKQVQSAGMAWVQRKSVKQIAVLYTAQLILVCLGVWAAYSGWESRNFPNMETLSVTDVVANAFMMTLAPPGGDVLRLYVFLLGLCMIAYPMLERGWWVAVLAGSFAIHLLGQAFPAATSFSPYEEQAASAGWAGWQLLFISALVLGWHWKSLNIPAKIDRHGWKVLLVCAVVALAFAAASVVLPSYWEEILFSKYTFPLGRIIVAYSVIAALYIVARMVVDKIPSGWLRPLVVTGSFSLHSYIIQAIVVVVAYGFLAMNSASPIAFAVAIATLLACWGWAEFKLRTRKR